MLARSASGVSICTLVLVKQVAFVLVEKLYLEIRENKLGVKLGVQSSALLT